MRHLQVNIDPVTDDNAWVSGKVGTGTYQFFAKVYDEPSEKGIDGGRISKLTIKRGNVDIEDYPEDHWSNVIVNFDRGWDIKPQSSVEMEIFHAILDELEKIPLYEERIFNGSKVKQIISKTKNKLSFGF